MQKINKFNIGATFATIMLLSAPVAVYAQDGVSGSGDVTTSNTTTTKTETESGETASGNPAEVETHEAAGATELRHKGADSVSGLKQKQAAALKQRTPEQHKKICEAHKDGLTNKFSHIVTNSQRTQKRIDDIFAKAQTFAQTSGQTPADFDSLVAAAMTAQTNSAASITALQAVTPSIDCNNTSVASDVATFKAAAQQTRDNLKAYKAAVKAVLKSLQTTKKATSEGSN